MTYIITLTVTHSFNNKEKQMIFKPETKTARLFEALKSGEQLSEGQIRVRFGIKNPRATVSTIRQEGFAVYANQHKDTKGRVTTKYRMGKPNRELIAAGYRAMALGL